MSTETVATPPRSVIFNLSIPNSTSIATQQGFSQHDQQPQGTESQRHHPYHLESHMSTGAVSKKKRSRSVKLDRKKVSRACDVCKARKVRCSGTQPCNRCSRSRVTLCEYNAEHRRGRPVSPELVESADRMASENNNFSNSSTNYVDPTQGFYSAPASMPSNGSSQIIEQRRSSRSSQEPDETRFEGHYIGPTSGIAFLHRAQRRIKQDFVNMHSVNSDDRDSSQPSVLKFGDGHSATASSSILIFPPRSEAKGLLDRYFEFAMPTYRFLDRATAEKWLENLCIHYENRTQLRQPLCNAKTAIVLLILATAILYGENLESSSKEGGSIDFEKSESFFIAAEDKIANETGPVRLESVQARLTQCIYLLGSSRINQAWYTFGTMCQMILALGLHRRRYSQGFTASSETDEGQTPNRLFWSAYTLDRYLSVILGRPSIFRDEDIDQLLPQRLHYAGLSQSHNKLKSVCVHCVSDGPVFHAKLAKIIGGISSDLYPTSKRLGKDLTDRATQRTAELKSWKESLPPFLEPEKVDPSMLIPIFQRQSTVLRLAYAHAMILANRQSLLSNFADLSRPETLPLKELQGSIKECIEAAMLVVDTANDFIDQGKMRRGFWFTHYVSFCAIATLYVYTIQKSIRHVHESSESGTAEDFQHFEAADRCQKNIFETTVSTSPFRRYNIILDELKWEVLIHLGRNNHHDVAMSEQRGNGHTFGRPGVLLDSSSGTTNRVPNQAGESSQEFISDTSYVRQVGQNFHHQPYLQEDSSNNMHPFTGTHEVVFNESNLDPGLFGLEGDLVGWSEFDACALNWPEGLDWTL